MSVAKSVSGSATLSDRKESVGMVEFRYPWMRSIVTDLKAGKAVTVFSDEQRRFAEKFASRLARDGCVCTESLSKGRFPMFVGVDDRADYSDEAKYREMLECSHHDAIADARDRGRRGLVGRSFRRLVGR